MTLFKLSMRNLKKSLKDYMVYFATLVLGVTIFYVFNSLDSQKAMLTLDESTMDIVQVMIDSLSVVSVFVAGVLGFLIVYASGFLMKRRKKEFAIYMLLGMTKRRIATILVFETIMIGVISLAIGLLFGVFVSQGMSIVIANMFEADLTAFHFTVSTSAIAKTMIYFVVIYLVVIVFNVFVVGKARLIQLINAGKRNQKNYARNPVLCAVVFLVACVILGSAYYNVTGGVRSIQSFANLGIEIAKGIIGTILVFWSIAGSLLFWVKKNKRFYYRNLNCFSMREFEDKVNSNVLSGSVICIMLFFTICGLSCSQSVKESANTMFRENAQADIEISYYIDAQTDAKESQTAAEYLKKLGFDMDLLGEQVEIRLYQFDMETDFGSLPIMSLSDYNHLQKLYGKPGFDLDEDQYAMTCNSSYAERYFNDRIAQNWEVKIDNRTYTSRFDACVHTAIQMSDGASNIGIMVLPDQAIDAYVRTRQDDYFILPYLIANYKDASKENLDKIDAYLRSDAFMENIDPWISVITRNELRKNTVGLSTLFVFIGLYLGMVFLISAAAILSLKELSGATDNKSKYMILRKLGVEEHMITKSLFMQSLIFFLLPLLLAVVHSIFGIQTGMFILEAFGRTGLKMAIIISACIILIIYGLYFVLTFLSSRSILRDVSYDRE
ncbi:MAG: ABC transporter permease [Wujia sp.]